MTAQKTKMIAVPDAYKMTFKRLLSRVPKDKRYDRKLQETLLMCMKLGGEALTRQRIRLEKVTFAEKPDLFKRRIPIVPKVTVTGDSTGETGTAPDTIKSADES